MVAVTELAYALSAALILFIVFSGIVILGISWTHYHYGFMRRRKRWQRKSRTSANTREK